LSCHSLVGSFKIEFFFFFYNIVEYTYEVVQYVSCLCTIYYVVYEGGAFIACFSSPIRSNYY
jgi:hypothetical protein